MAEIRTVPVSSLKPAPYNPRRIDAGAMAGLEKSIERFGLVEPLIFNERSGFVVGGHQRLKVLRAKKIRETQVVVVDLDETDEKALNVALNNPAITGEFSDKLGDLLAEIEKMNGALFADLRLDQLLAESDAKRRKFLAQDDLDDAPEPPADPVTQPGDVWVLDRHRLICGDSTDEKVVARLMGGGGLANLVFTDPPYGVNYDGGATVRRKLMGDDSTDLYGPACQMAARFSDERAPLYLWHAGIKSIAAAAAAAAAAYDIRCEIVWNKNIAQFGAFSAQYHQKHEPCYYCVKSKPPRWFGPTNEVTVWDVDRSQKNEYHPTQKPIALVERALNNSSADGAIVLDLFGGSGSTLIACEASHRSARLVELDPAYCDVIVERWQTLTGAKAIRNGIRS